MNPLTIQSLDIYHLTVLEHLLAECSVTRAAERLCQPQPNISRVLRRLRITFDDPLLVRSGARLVPTERGREIHGLVKDILDQVDRMTAPKPIFDPASTVREFRIGSADCLEPQFLAHIIAMVAEAGPHLSVTIQSVEASLDIGAALEEGHIDLVMDSAPNPPPNLMMTALYSDDLVCMVRKGHPLDGGPRLSLARYLALDHLAPQLSSRKDLGPVDGELRKLGLQRRIGAKISEYNMVPYILACSDFVFTTGRRFAEHYAQLMPFSLIGAPPELPPMHFYQLWHGRGQFSPAVRWLRSKVAEALRASSTRVDRTATPAPIMHDLI